MNLYTDPNCTRAYMYTHLVTVDGKVGFPAFSL